MNVANRINQLPAASISVVNALLAIFLILIMVATGIRWFGTAIGIIVGLLGGVALAVAICGTLAVLVNIRICWKSRCASGADYGCEAPPVLLDTD